MKKVYIVSDSIGGTGSRIYNRAAVQFPSHIEVEIVRAPFIHKKEEVDNLLKDVDPSNSLMIFTLVLPDVRKYFISKCDEMGILSIDVMTPAVRALTEFFAQEPILVSGDSMIFGEEYNKKIEAYEFAVQYDDGKNPKGLLLADIVLLGISRTSKTPLSVYLASKNIKVCNLPLVPEVKLPKELFEVDPKKIIGLTVDSQKAVDIRRERLRTMGVSYAYTDYDDIERIESELKYADALFKELNCQVIDVTNKSIEETALIIQEKYGRIN